MTKIKDIDIALSETLEVHPDFIDTMPALLSRNASLVYPRNFTSNNMARTRVSRLDGKDFIEYIVKNAVLIYVAHEEMKKEGHADLKAIFSNFSSIDSAIEILVNPNINTILYYEQKPNELFYLAEAVANTRFNPKWYIKDGKPQRDVNGEGEKLRRKIDSYSETSAKKYLTKIDHDVEVVKPISKMNINYTAMNRCLREIRANTQVKYTRNEYALDGTLFATQDVGKKRKNQEDSVLILTHPDNEQFKILVVADGMGGGLSGEKASNYVVKEISKWFMNLPADAYYLDEDIEKYLTKEIIRISDDIYIRYSGQAGSTLVGAVVTEKRTIIANVGDSRAYTIQDGKLTLVTEDDSVVYEQMRYQKKDKTIEDADLDDLRFNPRNNIITKSIGEDSLKYVPIITIPNNSYDKLLLFSDGVTDLLSQEEIKIIANSTPRDEITRALVDRAMARGIKKGDIVVSAGKDNATAAMYGR